MLVTSISGYIVTLFILLAGVQVGGDQADNPAPAAGGNLEINVTPPAAGSRKILAAVQNSGEGDVVLNLGIMLANGKQQFPTEVRLAVTDEKGATRQFRLPEPRIAGRADDFLVPLCAGATYTVSLDLDRLRPDNPAEAARKLPKGAYRVVAIFEGKDAQHVNSDLKGIALMEMVTTWQISVYDSTNTLLFSLSSPTVPLGMTTDSVVNNFEDVAPEITTTSIFLPALPGGAVDSYTTSFNLGVLAAVNWTGTIQPGVSQTSVAVLDGPPLAFFSTSPNAEITIAENPEPASLVIWSLAAAVVGIRYRHKWRRARAAV
jgi:hypothetical protein